LGVRDIRKLNTSLLVKWKWRLIFHDPKVWKEVLVAKYVPHIMGKVSLKKEVVQRVSSVWWKDICLFKNHLIGSLVQLLGRWEIG